ncbi:MAG: hypothetical protein JWN93_921, partial [Hyphomicrobiales bacterium]|nr:hypothetical protein [Hyphomicrobiales bacterium]
MISRMIRLTASLRPSFKACVRAALAAGVCAFALVSVAPAPAAAQTRPDAKKVDPKKPAPKADAKKPDPKKANGAKPDPKKPDPKKPDSK